VSGIPFSETTGVDANGDGIFNDRPDGHSRNTLRGDNQWALSLYAGYTIPFRRRTVAVTGIRATEFSGTAISNVAAFSDAVRYRVTLSAQAQNLTNRNNYVGYSGVRTSPFFNRPTAVLNPRRIVFNINFAF
jgi:hypothetical protein